MKENHAYVFLVPKPGYQMSVSLNLRSFLFTEGTQQIECTAEKCDVKFNLKYTWKRITDDAQRFPAECQARGWYCEGTDTGRQIIGLLGERQQTCLEWCKPYRMVTSV